MAVKGFFPKLFSEYDANEDANPGLSAHMVVVSPLDLSCEIWTWLCPQFPHMD